MSGKRLKRTRKEKKGQGKSKIKDNVNTPVVKLDWTRTSLVKVTSNTQSVLAMGCDEERFGSRIVLNCGVSVSIKHHITV